MPTRILSNVLFTLVEADMLNEIHRGKNEYDVSYAPARDINTLRVYDILEAVDNQGFGRDTIELQGSDIDACAAAVDQLKSVTRDSEMNVKILDLM